MTIAEIRGKISLIGSNLNERMEDLLTSDVFGAFKYLPPHLGILDFINTAINQDKKSFSLSLQPSRVEWVFWPYLQIPGAKNCEPDVLVSLEDKYGDSHIIMIEAKYYSSKSSQEDECNQPNDQLARELHNLQLLKPRDAGWSENITIKARTLVYITQNAGIPIIEINQSLDEYYIKRHDKQDIFWTSWRFLPQLIESIIGRAENEYQAAILQDLLDLLRRKHLTMFHGMVPIDFMLRPVDFVFYEMAPSKYIWPRFQLSASQLDFYRKSIALYTWPDIKCSSADYPKWKYGR